MDQEQLRSLFEQVRSGAMNVESAVERMRHMPFEDLGFAKVDHHRALRHGMPEVVFAQGKTSEQVVLIAEKLLENAPNVLITRANTECAELVTSKLAGAEYFPLSRRHPVLARSDYPRERQSRDCLRRDERYARCGRSAGHG